jgi:ABC-type Na+ transport system ATPase subunit NatA
LISKDIEDQKSFLQCTGMDPYSRRATWNIIRAAREGRVVVLTTHFMDEAPEVVSSWFLPDICDKMR